MTKSELRKNHLAKRHALSAEELATNSRQIADRFFGNIDLTAVKTVHTFIAIEKFNEVDTSLIYKRIWLDFPQIRTLAPLTDLDRDGLEHFEFDAGTGLVESRWGICEPVGGESVDAAEIDLVLVPLLCFDERGYRIGYGRGFYDKFLSRCRPDCLKVGLSVFEPVKVIGDADEHDVPLNHCITPKNIFSFVK